jgi:TolA-binding protein
LKSRDPVIEQLSIRRLAAPALAALLAVALVVARADAAAKPARPARPAEAESEADRQYDFASRLFSLRFYKTAAGEYRRFIDEFPDDPRREQARYNLAVSYYKIGRPEYNKALAELATLRKEFPNSSLVQDALFRAGHIHYLLGQSRRAADLLGALAKREKIRKDLRVPMHHYLGRAYAELGNHAEAIRHLSIVAGTGGHKLQPFALVVLADVQLGQGNPKAAAGTLEKLIKTHPKLPTIGEMRLKLGETRLALKDYKGALAAFRKAGGPGDLAVRAAVGRVQALMGLKQHAQAAKASRALLSGLKETPDLRELRVRERALYALGLAEFARRRHAPAAEAFEKLLEHVKTGDMAEDAAYKRCWCYYQLGADHARQLVASCEMFLNRFPKSEWTQPVVFLAGEGHLQLGNEDAAIKSFAKVSPKSDNYADALYRIAYCHHVQGRSAKAAAAYDTFLQKVDRHGKTADALASAGGLYQAIRQYKKAVERYRKYLEAEPKGPRAEAITYQVGLCYAKLSQFDEMAEWLERYVKRYPKGKHAAAAHYWLGRRRRLVADRVAAKKDLDAAIQAYTRAAQSFEGSLARLSKDHPDRDVTLLALAECRYDIGQTQAARADELDAAAKKAEGPTKAAAAGKAEEARKASDAMLLRAAKGFLELMGRKPKLVRGQPIYFWTSAFFREHDRPAEAIRALKILLDQFPKSDKADLALYQLAKLHAGLDPSDHAAAIQYADQLLANHKRSSLALHARFVKAESLFATGKYADAEPLYKQVSQKTFAGGLHLGSLVKLGHIAFRRKQYTDAVRYFAHVGVYEDPAISAEGLYYAGRSHIELQNRDEGLRFWGRLLKRHDGTEWAKKAREQLDAMGYAVGSDGQIDKKRAGG